MSERLERLAEYAEWGGPNSVYAAAQERIRDLEEALLWVRAESRQLTDMDCPFGSRGPAIVIDANAYFYIEGLLGNISQAEARERIREGKR